MIYEVKKGAFGNEVVGPYGHTYYFKDGYLFACPTFVDGTPDYEGELEVATFDVPLNQKELREIIDVLI